MRKTDQDYKNHKTTNLYKKINFPRKDFKPKERFLRIENGVLLTDIDGHTT